MPPRVRSLAPSVPRLYPVRTYVTPDLAPPAQAYAWIAVGRVGSTVDSITQRVVLATGDKRHKLKLVVAALKEKVAAPCEQWTT